MNLHLGAMHETFLFLFNIKTDKLLLIILLFIILLFLLKKIFILIFKKKYIITKIIIYDCLVATIIVNI